MYLSKLSVNKLNLLNFRYLSGVMSSKKKNKQTIQKSEETPTPKLPINIDKLGNIKINILAKPGAKQNGITDIGEEGVGVQIAAPPVDGEANQELIKYLSKLLGLRKSDLDLDKGSKSRQKIVLIQKNVITVEQIMATLNNEIDTK